VLEGGWVKVGEVGGFGFAVGTGVEAMFEGVGVAARGAGGFLGGFFGGGVHFWSLKY